MSKFVNYFLLFSVMLGSVACGDLFMKEQVEQDQSNQFAGCTLDTQAISRIMSEEIYGDIKCLESKLYLFIEIVTGGETDRPGYLSYTALDTFIQENIKETNEDILPLVSAIFDLNSILFGGDSNYISKKTIKRMTDILVDINRIMVESKVFEYFTSNKKFSFYEHNKRKAVIYSALIKVGKTLESATVSNKNSINISNLLTKLFGDGNREIIVKTKALLFMKKAILGGNEQNITSLEIKRLTKILGEIGKLSFDFIGLPNTKTDKNNEEDVLIIARENLLALKNVLFYKKNAEEVIITYEQITNLVKVFYPAGSDYLKYKASFIKLKEIFVGSTSPNFTSKDLYKIIDDILYKNIAKSVFIYRSYKAKEAVLESLRKIERGLTKLSIFTPEGINFAKDFNAIAMKYKYFQGSEFSAIYDFKIHRNPRAFVEIAIFRDLVSKLFDYYGLKGPGPQKGKTLGLKNFEKMLTDFQEVLVGEDFAVSGRLASTAETVMLMATLFHSQSNGDDELDIDEFVEVITTLTSSINLASSTSAFMEKECGFVDKGSDDKGRIEPACFRKNFIASLSVVTPNGKEIGSYVPGLRKFLENLEGQQEIDRFMLAALSFSRSCTHFTNGREVPMTSGEFFTSWSGLLVIEQAMILYDNNRNGTLEPKELDHAYQIYKGAVKGMIPFRLLRKYSKSLFQYMIMFQKVPAGDDSGGFRNFWRSMSDNSQFLRFVMRREHKKRTSADRTTLASVLQILSENSPAKLAKPYVCVDKDKILH